MGGHMFNFLKKKICVNCGKVNKNGINYAGYEICSENCMVDFFKNCSWEELFELEMKDRRINERI